MLVLAMNPGHDGAAAAVKDGRLLFSLESEKDSFRRHSELTPATVLQAAERLGEIPEVVAFTGGFKDPVLGNTRQGAGYDGIKRLEQRRTKFLGHEVTRFSSSHERSHIMAAVGLAPRDDSQLRAALVWEGAFGAFYLVDEHWNITHVTGVVYQPGTKYAFLFALADPTFPDVGAAPRNDDSGKLMALAAYGDAADADGPIADTVERILAAPTLFPAPKDEFRDSPLYNAGVESDTCKTAAALLSDRMFELFSAAASEQLPSGIPLHIGGGCGLNCDWNTAWRELGHFSSVFVPPCPNDAGSAIGTAVDAQVAFTGDPYIDWSVYAGLEFEWDSEPDPRVWRRREVKLPEIADALLRGRIFAWVQGRAEIGPRALGNRSILAEPSHSRTRDRLNEIKQRESYRPIAPCCRIEDVGKVFDRDFEDPYMLYFRMATTDRLGAVTHVDGSARCQTVTSESNKPLHDVLCAVADRNGVGVLCNTSLNFKGLGFINRMSDLTKYSETRALDDVVVGDTWFERNERS